MTHFAAHNLSPISLNTCPIFFMSMALASSEVYDFMLDVPEIDGDLLMELLEESSTAMLYNDELEESCGLDGVLSDFERSPELDVLTADYMFDWPEMDDGMTGWYVDLEEMNIDYEDKSNQCGELYYCEESSIEQVYDIPLWQ